VSGGDNDRRAALPCPRGREAERGGLGNGAELGLARRAWRGSVTGSSRPVGGPADLIVLLDAEGSLGAAESLQFTASARGQGRSVDQ